MLGKGKLKTTIELTFSPTGGTPGSTQTMKLTLKRK